MKRVNIDKTIKEIKKTYNNAIDITTRIISIKRNKLALIFNQSLCDSDKINKYILENITRSNLNYKKLTKNISSLLGCDNLIEINNKEIYNYISNGFTIILTNKNIYAVETKANLYRAISSPTTEQTVNGPKDSFNENYMTIIGLIRKRIKTNNLVFKEKIIGKETKTKIGYFYMNNIIEENLISTLNEKLDNIDIDGIFDITYIREYLDSNNSMFPIYETTERPDLACMSLLDGKIIIICENSPNVLIVPTFLKDLFQTPEDNYGKNKNVSVNRIVRILSFIIAIILPGFYIAITTYNHETIPITLIISFAAQRDGVPFPSIVEGFIMALIFEVLRESDIRMPSQSGNAISILGAIVLGDAAVSAGIVSPIMLIIIAISAICGLTFSHLAIINAIRFWRVIFMLFGTFLGIPGLIFCLFLFIIKLSSIKSFGKPYLYPLSPINFKMITSSIIKKELKKDNKRNTLLTDTNYKRSNI